MRIRTPKKPATLARTTQLRLYGLVFLAVIALLLSLTVAVYQQVFTSVVRITLEADTLGNQMEPRADVKLRGLLVGEVREVRADGEKATLGIALKPEHVRLIPADVHARLLPKTLFGEKYVDLVEPAKPSARHIRAGDVITQDRTTVGIELQQLMNDLLPLLRTLQPAKLNATLSAFSTALEGRGDKIGDNLVRLEDYLRRLNPHLPSLQKAISRLADVVEVYGEAAPDLLRVLRNTLTTSRTLVEREDRLASVLTWTATAADTAAGVLDENSDRLITLGRVSRPTLALFARYSPEYPCLLAGLVRQGEESERAFSGGKMRITLEFVPQRPPYRPGEEPRYADRSGPDCRGLPHPRVPGPPTRLNDGTSASRSPRGAAPSVSGTPAEQNAVASLVAPAMGVPADEVPAVATLLFGPMARGTAVSVA
ncbi:MULTISPECIES: MCE family protein [Streptomyces]|uniref:MCE family protein n=2 Tax=Streptomyces TaxID=1883 RepID=A0A420V5U8_9ACTN|nr:MULTISPECIES: MCE family protein [Streptomyces]KNE81756.1 mammalian cell entry protein [Streptomyces fradiae]OFA50650.1 mammalian cell entry protein [Streptomyces fradiae]PQM24079.1 MCE family protein [Streptomyces xinghaiensis]RKM97043.1 MCE family protein [Streptomyces xinghaiensis]RNC75563.1 MCE family protein [Streptomyces xinghaiensis]